MKEQVEYKRNVNKEIRDIQSGRIKFLRRITLVFATISYILIGITLIFTPKLFNSFDKTTTYIVWVSAGVVIGFSIYIFRYLQSNRIVPTSDANKEVKKELQNLKLDVLKLANNRNSEGLESINKAVNDIITGTLTDDYLKEKLGKALNNSAIEDAKLNTLKESILDLKDRIDDEIDRLTKSSSVNLTIGIAASLIAIIILGYSILFMTTKSINTTSFLIQFLPRLSFVVFIEILSFFFLKIYKTLLEDIKYFNNEKTNVDFKIISLETAIFRGDKSLIDTVIAEFIKTERNFKLGKYESTVALEKSKNETTNNKLMTELLTKLTDKI